MTRSDPPLQGGFFNPKEGWPPNDRAYMSMPAEGRLPTPASQPQSHSRPQSISNALRDCVRLPAKDFALVVVLDNGDMQTFTSPTLSQYHDKIFSDGFRSTFSRVVRRSNTEGSFANNQYGQEGGLYNSFEFEGGSSMRHGSASSSESSRGFHKTLRSEDNDGEGSGTTKRARRNYGRRTRDNTSDDTLTPVPTRKTQTLEIGNSAQVEEFYLTRFKDMQQTACKTMGKAFVKLVEPKKQTHHPYTRGDDSAPPWWPTQKEDHDHYVRHKEPDHLYKKERIRLLVHILRMIVLPVDKQHPSVQKVGLSVRKLEEVTNEAMSTWFGDNDHPENKKKRTYLKEIFKVAKMEERFFNGEVDGTTNVPVIFGDRSNLETADESEDEGLAFDTPPASHHGDVEHNTIGASMATPESMPMISPPLVHHDQIHSAQSDSMRVRQLPHRYNSQSMESQSGFTEHNYYSRNMDTFQQSPAISEPIRRTFTSPDYHNSQNNGLGWQQQTMVTASPGGSGYYTHASVPPSSGPIFQMAQTLPPPQSMIAHNISSHFDGLPSLSGRYDANIGPVPGTQFRTGSLGHPHQMHPQGFEGYLHSNEGQFSHHGEEMKEEPQQPQQQQHSHQHHHLQHPQ